MTRPGARFRMNTDIVARFATALLTAFTPYAALALPGSAAAKAADHQAVSAYPLFVLMALVAVAIVTDIVLNGSGPTAKVRWLWLSHQRSVMYGIATFSALVAPYTAIKISSVDPAASFIYLVLFVIGSLMLWADFRAKLEGRCVPTH